VKIQVEELNCKAKLVHDGDAGFAEAEKAPYDLIILDLMLPGLDGLEITRRLRARNSYTPLLMLTSRATEVDRVLGLEMGADDYLTKPFSVLELRARVKAIFRRMEQMPPNADVAEKSSRQVRCVSIPSAAPFARMACRSISPRASSTCCCSSPETRGASIPASNC